MNKPTIVFSGESEEVIIPWLLAFRAANFRDHQISMNDFDILSVIGRGFYGKVMLCKSKLNGALFAIKSIHKSRLYSSNKVHTVVQERKIMSKSNYPFIVTLCFAFQSPTKFYFALEYIPGGDLFHEMQKDPYITRYSAKLYIAEIGLALRYLHSINVIYRDLKPENILIDKDGHIKLTDFGLSKILDVDSVSTTFCGTAEYIAPEIIRRLPYTNKIDWWALGVLSYELLFRSSPFMSNNRMKLFQLITSTDPPFPNDVDPVDIDFVKRLLTKNPKRRASLDDLWNHPFWESMKLEDIEKKLVKPDYVPTIIDHSMPTNFDETYTSEPPTDSMATPLASIQGSRFNGFSYIAKEDESTQNDTQNSVLIPE